VNLRQAHFDPYNEPKYNGGILTIRAWSCVETTNWGANKNTHWMKNMSTKENTKWNN